MKDRNVVTEKIDTNAQFAELLAEYVVVVAVV
jgi:hypothetical protein